MVTTGPRADVGDIVSFDQSLSWRIAGPITAARGAQILANARQRLRAAGYPGLWHVSCSLDRRVLSLWGSVPSYYLKQMAQTVVRGLDQVDRIVNHLEVDPLG